MSRAGMKTEGTFAHDNLFAGEFPRTTRKATIISGAGILARGTLLGSILLGALDAASVFAGTGNGVLTLGNPKTLAGAQVGVYKVICIEPAGNGGMFAVEDPKGKIIGNVAVGANFATQIAFSIADGATDFVAGDTFSITVTAAAGSGKYKKSLAAAEDGSAVPISVLAEDVDASAADVEAIVYDTGTFNELALTLGAGHTIGSVRMPLRELGIHIAKVVPA